LKIAKPEPLQCRCDRKDEYLALSYLCNSSIRLSLGVIPKLTVRASTTNLGIGLEYKIKYCFLISSVLNLKAPFNNRLSNSSGQNFFELSARLPENKQTLPKKLLLYLRL